MKLKRRKKVKRIHMPKMKPQEGWTTCPNCGEFLKQGGHFLPPCFGEEGFFTCKPPKFTHIG